MRISDWSSDVCSSDLCPAVSHICRRSSCPSIFIDLSLKSILLGIRSVRPVRARTTTRQVPVHAPDGGGERSAEVVISESHNEASLAYTCMLISDRKSVVSGKGGSVLLDIGGRL